MLDKFKDYLAQKGTIKPNYIPFYQKWVADCYSFLGIADSQRINSDQKKAFLAHMAKKHEDRQVRQADAALRLYDYFLSQATKESSLDLNTASSWQAVEEKMREALRLRHRSYSTEKTYLSWLRSFRQFVNHKDRVNSPAAIFKIF